MKPRRLLYPVCIGAMLLPLCSCADWMLSGGDLFYDDPYAPAPPVLYDPPLPNPWWGIGQTYYPGWNGPVYVPNRPAPPPPSNPVQRPPQPSAPPPQSPSGQRPGANIIFGNGSGSNSGTIQNRPEGGAGGRH